MATTVPHRVTNHEAEPSLSELIAKWLKSRALMLGSPLGDYPPRKKGKQAGQNTNASDELLVESCGWH